MKKKKTQTEYLKVLLIVKPEFNLPYKKINSPDDYNKDGKFVIAFNDIQSKIPDFSLNPLFTSVKINSIKKLTETAIKTDPGYRPVDFSKHFYFNLKNISKQLTKKQLRVLSDSILFERVIIEEEPILAVPTPDYTSQQTYLAPLSPINLGIDLDIVRGERGGDGAGINFIDIERDWNFSHEDLRDMTVSLGFGRQSGIQDDIKHGTSVLGIIAANDNGSGCKGIAPNCTITTISYLEPDGRTANIYEAMIYALHTFQYGDIVLLEIQTISSNAPVEIGPVIQQVIRLATALGIVIIEAAGDGTNDLDTMIDGMLYPDNPDYYDSGAIIVGGVDITTRTKLYSSQGARINCFAPSAGVFAPSGISAAGIANDTYHYFSGTSSASAIIAGVAISIQGIISNRSNRYFRKWNSFQMRNLLGNKRIGIKPVPEDDQFIIGVMPNFANLMSHLNVENVDIYIRDNIDDNGDRYAGAISVSPDVITTQSRVADPDAAFGVGSHTENRMDLGDIIKRDTDNYIYIRVLNRGTLPAFEVQVKLFYTLASTLVAPDRWNYIGSTIIPVVHPDNILTVSPDPIVWASADIPADGHYCFIAVIGNSDDPFPLPFSNNPTNPLQGLVLDDYNMFTELIRNQNNITWRNFNVVELDGSSIADLSFFIAAPAIRTTHTFHINGILPEGTIIRLILNKKLAGRFKSMKPVKDPDIATEIYYVEWINNSSYIFRNITLKNIKLPKKMFEKCRLKIIFPEQLAKNDEYQISISQHINNEMVGRITWIVRNKKKK